MNNQITLFMEFLKKFYVKIVLKINKKHFKTLQIEL